MKRLHKKIGVGVLVAGLLLGAGGISGGSVAHANENYEAEYKQGLLNKAGEFSYVVNSIYGLGKESNFFVAEVGEEGISKLISGYSIHELKLKYEDLSIDSLMKILSKKPRGSRIKLVFEDIRLEILIIIIK